MFRTIVIAATLVMMVLGQSLPCSRIIPEKNSNLMSDNPKIMWGIDSAKKILTVEYTDFARMGWAGLGFQAPGQSLMGNGTFIMGYITGDNSGCVAVGENRGSANMRPTIIDNAGVVSSTSVSRVNNEGIVLRFTLDTTKLQNVDVGSHTLLAASSYSSQNIAGLQCPFPVGPSTALPLHAVSTSSSDKTKPANIKLYGHSWLKWDGRDCIMQASGPSPQAPTNPPPNQPPQNVPPMSPYTPSMYCNNFIQKFSADLVQPTLSSKCMNAMMNVMQNITAAAGKCQVDFCTCIGGTGVPCSKQPTCGTGKCNKAKSDCETLAYSVVGTLPDCVAELASQAQKMNAPKATLDGRCIATMCLNNAMMCSDVDIANSCSADAPIVSPLCTGLMTATTGPIATMNPADVAAAANATMTCNKYLSTTDGLNIRAQNEACGVSYCLCLGGTFNATTGVCSATPTCDSQCRTARRECETSARDKLLAAEPNCQFLINQGGDTTNQCLRGACQIYGCQDSEYQAMCTTSSAMSTFVSVVLGGILMMAMLL